MNLPDITAFFYLAMFGLVCAALFAIGGAAWFVYFIIYHIQIV
ncbi:hypothetical protein [Rhizobium sp. RCAM05973]|nr:hypothetical protein [Rhizobium sp. RCAM05973]